MSAISCATVLPWLKKLVPSYRFRRVTETVLGGSIESEDLLGTAPLKILNWNIAKQNRDRSWIQDFREILIAHKPDFVLLQEVQMAAQTNHAIGLAEMSWSFAPNFLDAYHDAYSGLLTAARVRHLSSQRLLSPHAEPVTRTPKISLISEYALSHSSQTLLVVNTHLINFVDLRKFRAQLHEIEAVIARHPGFVIFSGDFNTWSRARNIILQETIDRLGLQPVVFGPDHHQKIKRFLLSPPLDHIFYRGLQQRSIATVLDHICSSDHKPMLVELTFAAA